MHFQIKISPSILSADYGNLREECIEAEKGKGDAIHIDIMDGHYCHNFSFGIAIVPTLKSCVNIPLVAHLEIDNPDNFIGDFARAGSDMIVVQEDTCPNLPLTIENIIKKGVKAGIGINPDRGFDKIEANPDILKKVDLIIVMAVYPGFGGQPFSPVTLPKIKKAVSLRDRVNTSFDIGIDGSVNTDTVPKLVSAGANYLIAGSSIFSGGEIKENIRSLRDCAGKQLKLK